MPLTAVVLAAGLRTRMRSPLAKVLHPLLGRPMVGWEADGSNALAYASDLACCQMGKEMQAMGLCPQTRSATLRAAHTAE